MAITNSSGVTEQDIIRIMTELADRQPGSPTNLVDIHLQQFRSNPEGYDAGSMNQLAASVGMVGVGGAGNAPTIPAGAPTVTRNSTGVTEQDVARIIGTTFAGRVTPQAEILKHIEQFRQNPDAYDAATLNQMATQKGIYGVSGQAAPAAGMAAPAPRGGTASSAPSVGTSPPSAVRPRITPPPESPVSTRPEDQADYFPWQTFLEQQPEGVYESALGGLGKEQRNFFQNRFGQMQRKYLGSLVDFAQQNPGKAPTQQFGDYLKNFDWSGEFLESPDRPRDDSTRDPRTKFLYNRR